MYIHVHVYVITFAPVVVGLYLHMYTNRYVHTRLCGLACWLLVLLLNYLAGPEGEGEGLSFYAFTP